MPSETNLADDPSAVFAEIVGFTNSKLTTMVIKDLIAAGVLPETAFARYAEELRAMAATISQTPPDLVQIALCNLATQLDGEISG